MSRFDKINTAITELPPTSANKVFSFINQLFEENLDKELFKENFWNFNVSEQYYLCYYLKLYFNSSERYTFFNKWIREKELKYSQAGEEQLFHDFKEALLHNKIQLADILVSYEKTADRRLKQLKKHKVPFDEYAEYFRKGQIDYKIPLHYKPNQFKSIFLNLMKGFMSQDEAELVFYNSFDFRTNLYSIQLLNIELDNLTDIKEGMAEVKSNYDLQRVSFPKNRTV